MEKEEGPGWRSGRSSSTPVRRWRSIPLSPTMQHLSHTFPHFWFADAPRTGENPHGDGLFGGGTRWENFRPEPHVALQNGGPQARLRVSRGSVRGVCLRWEPVGRAGRAVEACLPQRPTALGFAYAHLFPAPRRSPRWRSSPSRRSPSPAAATAPPAPGAPAMPEPTPRRSCRPPPRSTSRRRSSPRAI